VAIGCITLLFRIRPAETRRLIFADDGEAMPRLVDLLANPDPLLRGYTAGMLGEIIAAHLRLRLEQQLMQLCDVPAMVEAIIACFRDRSSVASKMACNTL
jgi:hypothetical protein